MSVNHNILKRTFGIRCGEKSGTCFTVDIDNKRYLVTAKHLVEEVQNQDTIHIRRDEEWIPYSVRLVGAGPGDSDISVLAPDCLFGETTSLLVSTENMEIYGDVYFLGFPYNLNCDSGNLNAQYPFPLAKKGILSAFCIDKNLLLLDGHNNPGFSGGPVVLGNKSEQIIGVISGYKPDTDSVLDKNGKAGPYTYTVNTGIVYAYDSRIINELVAKNPIGIKLR